MDREQIAKVAGRKKSHRPGLYYCNACKGQFTVTVGTVMERSKVALHKWVLAFHLHASSKKGISAHQLHRMLDVQCKTAWYMAHRIREAMRNDDDTAFGTDGGEVEVDETFIGRDKSKKPKGEKKGRGGHHKYKVLSLVDRRTGRASSMVGDDLKGSTLLPILNENIARKAIVCTDEAGQCFHLGDVFAGHETVRHTSGEYGRGTIHTNTIEGYFSIFKRGMKGVYQHCGRQHLHRYVAEFEFRYNHRIANVTDDDARAALIAKGAEGRRLTYRRPAARASA